MKSLNNLLQDIKYPLFTEKSIKLINKKQYSFIVNKELTKLEIKSILENNFNIKIISINTCILPKKIRKVGKYIGNKPQYKKVYIKVNEDNYIKEFFK